MLTLLAPAKINLTLEILGRRADGYHALRSLMLPIARYDRIELAPSATTRFETSDAALAIDNLVMRALATCGAPAAYAVRLEKTIPVGGGLGGGSSDGAAILRAAMAGRFGEIAERDWIATALALGSDVPFFLVGTGALVEGFGERVTAIGALPPWWLVVARPHASVATADAYRLLDASRASVAAETRPRSTSASLLAVDAVQRRDFPALVATLVNDFHEPICAAYPAVARSDAALRAAGARHVLLSGSGSCLFALFPDEAGAREVAARVDPASCETHFTVPFHHDEAWR